MKKKLWVIGTLVLLVAMSGLFAPIFNPGGGGGGGSNHNMLSGTHSDSTTASGVQGDLIRFNTTWERLGIGANGLCLVSNGTLPSWGSCTAGGAPSSATYIVQTADGTLSAEQALSALASALLVNTTGTGVLSAYAGVTCTNQVLRVLSAVGAGTCVTISSAFVDSSIALTSSSNSWGDGVRQTFNPDATNAGLNVGSHTTDPSSPVAGDIYYTTTNNVFSFYENGSWKNLGIQSEVDTLATVFARGDTLSTNESTIFKIRGTGGQASNGFNIYQHSNGTPTINPVCSGVENDCNHARKIASGKTWSLQNSSGVDKFLFTESTGALTKLTLDAEADGNTITIPDERHFAVGTCQNTTPTANFDLPTTNAPAPTCDTGSNTQKAYLAFDATTDEAFEDHWILPTGFTGAIDVHFRWKAAATTGSVGWCAQLVRVADGSTSDPAYPAQAAGNCVSDTAKGTTLQENSATKTGVTCTSCAAGDHVYVRISRDANGGAVTDDMTGDALLLTYGRTIRVAN